MAQHAWAEVNPGNVDISGVEGQAGSGADPNFQQLTPGNGRRPRTGVPEDPAQQASFLKSVIAVGNTVVEIANGPEVIRPLLSQKSGDDRGDRQIYKQP